MQILFLNYCRSVQPHSGYPLLASAETLQVKMPKCPDKVVMTYELQIFQYTVNNNNSALTYILENTHYRSAIAKTSLNAVSHMFCMYLCMS